MVLDLVDHLGAEHGVHKSWPGDGDECAQNAPGKEEKQSRSGIREKAAEDARVIEGEELPERGTVQFAALSRQNYVPG